jgi:GMP synthase (glutamine-hydrolysing)
MYGLQFHPEVTHSVFAETILGNFIASAGLKGSWRMDNFIEEQVRLAATVCAPCSR